MVVADFRATCLSVIPFKAHAPLVVNTNTPLSLRDSIVKRIFLAALEGGRCFALDKPWSIPDYLASISFAYALMQDLDVCKAPMLLRMFRLVSLLIGRVAVWVG